MHSSQIENCPLRTEVSPLYTVSVKIRVICHKSTVILIELRRTFSMPENCLKLRFSPFQSINEPRCRAILRRGFVRFTFFVVSLAKVSVKFMGIR